MNTLDRIQTLANSYNKSYGTSQLGSPQYLLVGAAEAKDLATELWEYKLSGEQRYDKKIPSVVLTSLGELRIILSATPTQLELVWGAERVSPTNYLTPYYLELKKYTTEENTHHV